MAGLRTSSAPNRESQQTMLSHAYVQYALLTALYLLFRLDP